MSNYKEGQVHQFMDAFEAAGATPRDLTEIGQSPALIQDVLLLARGTGKITVSASSLIPINHNFNPVKFITEGWSISDKIDARSVVMIEFDPNKIELVTMLKEGEVSITGEENLRRLKETDYTPLGIDIFFTLWENKSLIPESLKEKVNGNTRFIFFDDTILRYPDGRCYTMYLYWAGGCWDWSAYWMGHGRDGHNQSAVFAS